MMSFKLDIVLKFVKEEKTLVHPFIIQGSFKTIQKQIRIDRHTYGKTVLFLTFPFSKSQPE